MVKDYSFSNNEAEKLRVDVVKTNSIKSVEFNGKSSYRIVKTDNISDATLLFPEDTIILDKTEVSISSRDTVTNTIRMKKN